MEDAYDEKKTGYNYNTIGETNLIAEITIRIKKQTLSLLSYYIVYTVLTQL